MIILSDNRNQMCNRLWAFSFFVAFGLKYNVVIYIPNFKKYESFFENLNQYGNVKFNLSENQRTEKCIRISILLLNILHKTRITYLLRLFNIYFPNSNTLNDYFKDNKKKVLINSWRQKKDFDAFLEFKPQIISLFTPKEEFRRRTDTLFMKFKPQFDLVVGVHIRRGDYVDFRNGIYCFDDSIYSKYMKMLKENFASKKVAFYISTNEKIIVDNFSDLNIYFLENSNGIEDLYALSKCDYIMGPPSTFSMWASFYGSVPLKLIENKTDNFSLKDFSIIRYLNNFENGNEYKYQQLK